MRSEIEPSLGRFIKVHTQALWHQATRAVFEIPLLIKIVKSPDAVLTRDGSIPIFGKSIDHGKYFVSEDWEVIFPNKAAGDLISEKIEIANP